MNINTVLNIMVITSTDWIVLNVVKRKTMDSYSIIWINFGDSFVAILLMLVCLS